MMKIKKEKIYERKIKKIIYRKFILYIKMSLQGSNRNLQMELYENYYGVYTKQNNEELD